MADNGAEHGIKGVVEDVKGKAKEAVGVVTGNDDLEKEGEAQQEKAEANREVAAKEAEAEKARAEAEVKEAEQKTYQ
ncbi:microaggregate-binding protein 1 [Actinospongicola halichondriae]|uniref:microaggregate-binding protein 1 n=1 Tax=Actinospongicola halichondriae TaxID=3236844 RepID=UPI003D58F7A5